MNVLKCGFYCMVTYSYWEPLKDLLKAVKCTTIMVCINSDLLYNTCIV